MKTSNLMINDAFNVETDIVPAETTKVEKRKSNQMVITSKRLRIYKWKFIQYNRERARSNKRYIRISTRK